MLNVGTYLQTCSLNEIRNGAILGSVGKPSSYKIFNGNSCFLSSEADQKWQLFYLELFGKAKASASDFADLESKLKSIVMEDRHWRWLDKSIIHASNEYEWFYLIADDEVQGMCLVYHPKDALLETGKIFYVEYVAIAPWNRRSMLNDRRYEQIGTILLKAASEFAHNQLSLKPGFSLHSLPQSESYYTRQGMVTVSGQEKDTMKYFEMPQLTNNEWRST